MQIYIGGSIIANIDDCFGDLASTGGSLPIHVVCTRSAVEFSHTQLSESYLHTHGWCCSITIVTVVVDGGCYPLLGSAEYGSGETVWLCSIVLGRAE